MLADLVDMSHNIEGSSQTRIAPAVALQAIVRVPCCGSLGRDTEVRGQRR